jgi:hypothetical protein
VSSTLRDIADALAASLAAETFSSVTDQPTVERKNWPAYDVDDLRSPVIAVTPGGAEATRIARPSVFEYDYAVSVFLGRHTPTEAGADEMLDMAEELLDLIRAHDWSEGVTWPTGCTSPMTVEIEINPDDALQERNVWRAVITATYRVHRT